MPDIILDQKEQLTKMYRSYVDDYINVLALFHELRNNNRWVAHVKAMREAKVRARRTLTVDALVPHRSCSCHADAMGCSRHS